MDTEGYYLEESFTWDDIDTLLQALKSACDALRDTQGATSKEYLILKKFYEETKEDAEFFRPKTDQS